MEYVQILHDRGPRLLEPVPETEKPGRGWGWRFLPRFKTVAGKRYQLHATRGWKCIGRARA